MAAMDRNELTKDVRVSISPNVQRLKLTGYRKSFPGEAEKSPPHARLSIFPVDFDLNRR